MNTNIKGQTVTQWLAWINNELNPPHKLDAVMVYTMEAFRDALLILEQPTQQDTTKE